MKKKAQTNWTNARILYELRKKELSLSELSRQNNYKSNGLRNAFERSYPRAEKIIANAIGVTPQTIWPDRY